MATNNSINNSAQELNLPTTTSSSSGVININSTQFVSAFGTNNTFLGSGSGNFSMTGTDNVGIGHSALTATSSGSQRVAIGSGAAKSLLTSAGAIAIGYNAATACTGSLTGCIVIGQNAFASFVSGGSAAAHILIGVTAAQNWTGVGSTANTIIGSQAASVGVGTACSGNSALGTNTLQASTTASFNNCLGGGTLENLTTGLRNQCIGFLAGSSYTTSESDNILIGSNLTGTVGESNTLRIGTATGTSTGQLSKSYISGIAAATLSAGSPTPHLTLVDSSNNQLVSPTPVDAATATSTYGQLAIGTALQNTANYPILVSVSVAVTVATTATIAVGVGSTNTPTAQTVIPSFTVALFTPFSFSFVVPAKYFAQVTTTGTITVGTITTLATQIG